MRVFNFLILTISTFFYIGYLPFIPGTFGSVAGLFLFYALKDSGLNLAATCILIILGFLVAGRAEALLKKKDARCIIIDEISGMFLSLIFLPFDIKIATGAFFLFRLLDSLKPYPAGQLQILKGSAGVMLDDIVAGLYTNLILQIALRWPSFRTS